MTSEAIAARRSNRLIFWLFALALGTLVAHGCHSADHGDADLSVRARR